LDLRELPSRTADRDDYALFSESNSRFLVEVSEKAKDDFEALAKGSACGEIGRVSRTSRLLIRGFSGRMLVDASLNDLMASWKRTLSSEV